MTGINKVERAFRSVFSLHLMWCPDDSWCEALPFLGEALTVEASKVNVSAPVFSLRNTLWIQWIDKWNAWCWNQLERSHRDLTIFFATCLFSGRCEHCWIDRIGCYLRWFEIGFEVTDSVHLALLAIKIDQIQSTHASASQVGVMVNAQQQRTQNRMPTIFWEHRLHLTFWL